MSYFLPSSYPRYVYFSSLLESKANQFKWMVGQNGMSWGAAKRATGVGAINYISKTPVDGQFNSMEDIKIDQFCSKMIDVTAAIRRIADRERAKEERFIDVMMSKDKEDKLIHLFNGINRETLQDSNGLNEFILRFNTALTDLEDFKQQVNYECERLKANRDAYTRARSYEEKHKGFNQKKNMTDEEKSYASILQGNYKRTLEYEAFSRARSAAENLIKNVATNSFGNILMEYILKQNLERFIEINQNLEITCNTGQLQSLLTSVVMKAMMNFFKSKGDTTKIFKSGSRNYQKMSEEFNDYFNAATEEGKRNAEQLFGMSEIKAMLNSDFFVKNIARSVQEHIGTVATAQENDKRRLNKTRQRRYRNLFEGQEVGSEGLNALINDLSYTGGIGVHADFFKKNSVYLMDEVATLVNNTISNGNIASIGLARGGAYQKVDIGQLVIKVDMDADNFLTKNSETVQLLLDANKKYNNEMRSIHNDVTRGESTDYSVRVKNAYNELIETFNDLIKSATEKQRAFSAFHINYSNKIYESFKRTTSSFSGGQLGANLPAILAKVENVINASNGALGIGDSDWLITALMNCASGTVVGTSQKSMLEYYLSMIATTLLFEDYNMLGAEASLDFNLELDDGVQTLNVFNLQGTTTVPISYILYKIADDFEKALNGVERNLSNAIKGNQVVKATISTGGFPTGGYWPVVTAADWGAVASQALSAIDIQLVFLGNFLDVINSLNNVLGDL